MKKLTKTHSGNLVLLGLFSMAVIFVFLPARYFVSAFANSEEIIVLGKETTALTDSSSKDGGAIPEAVVNKTPTPNKVTPRSAPQLSQVVNSSGVGDSLTPTSIPPLPAGKQQKVEPVGVGELIYKHFGAEWETAKTVSFCESSLNPKAKSKISSAKGLFQIIDGTWKSNKCTGDPFNAEDNISCAVKIHNSRGWQPWKSSMNCHNQK